MGSFLAPAKINLALHVTGRRADGYHLLQTLVVFTRFGDRINVAGSEQDQFSASGPFGDHVPLDGTNLVVKARDHFRRCYPRIGCRPVSLSLEKNLPPASGIGGGSSDAAATLRALNSMAPGTGLLRRGGEFAMLGADVPMCLAARPLMARGIGEKLVILEGFPSLAMVLVNPGIEMSTPTVFRALRLVENPPFHAAPPTGQTDLIGWLRETRNDLEAPAREISPSIGDVLATVRDTGAFFARMSGSGATCFGLFDDMHAAEDAAQAIRQRQPGWFTVATRSMASTEELDNGN